MEQAQPLSRTSSPTTAHQSLPARRKGGLGQFLRQTAGQFFGDDAEKKAARTRPVSTRSVKEEAPKGENRAHPIVDDFVYLQMGEKEQEAPLSEEEKAWITQYAQGGTDFRANMEHEIQRKPDLTVELAEDFITEKPMEKLKRHFEIITRKFAPNEVPPAVIATVIQEFLKTQEAVLNHLSAGWNHLDHKTQLAVVKAAIEVYRTDSLKELVSELSAKNQEKVEGILTRDLSMLQGSLSREAKIKALIKRCCPNEATKQEAERLFTQVEPRPVAIQQIHRLIAGIEGNSASKESESRAGGHWIDLYSDLARGQLTATSLLSFHAPYFKVSRPGTRGIGVPQAEADLFKESVDGLFASAIKAEFGEHIAAAWAVRTAGQSAQKKQASASVFLDELGAVKNFNEAQRAALLVLTLRNELIYAKEGQQEERWFQVMKQLLNHPNSLKIALKQQHKAIFGEGSDPLAKLGARIKARPQTHELTNATKSELLRQLGCALQSSRDPEIAAAQCIIDFLEERHSQLGDTAIDRSDLLALLQESYICKNLQQLGFKAEQIRTVMELVATTRSGIEAQVAAQPFEYSPTASADASFPENAKGAIREIFSREQSFRQDMLELAYSRDKIINYTLMGAASAQKAGIQGVTREELESYFDGIERLVAASEEFNTLLNRAYQGDPEHQILALANALASDSFIRYSSALAELSADHERLRRPGGFIDCLENSVLRAPPLQTRSAPELRAAADLADAPKQREVSVLERWLTDPTQLIIKPSQRLAQWPLSLERLAKELGSHPLLAPISEVHEITTRAAGRGDFA